MWQQRRGGGRHHLRRKVLGRRWGISRRGEPAWKRGCRSMDHDATAFSLRLVRQDGSAVGSFATVDLGFRRFPQEQGREGEEQESYRHHCRLSRRGTPDRLRDEENGFVGLHTILNYRLGARVSQCERPIHFFRSPKKSPMRPTCSTAGGSGYSTQSSCEPRYMPSR